MLYNGINSSVSLPKGTFPRFDIKRGIRQGCASSPLLFIMVADMLSILIKNEVNIKGLNFMGNEFIISKLADDTTLFLENEKQISVALKTIDFFSKASGLKSNVKKCELMAIHGHPLVPLHNIPIKN